MPINREELKMRIKCELHFANSLTICTYFCSGYLKYIYDMNKYVVYTVIMIAAICICVVWDNVTLECWTTATFIAGVAAFLIYDLHETEFVKKEMGNHFTMGCISLGVVTIGALTGTNMVFIPCLFAGAGLGLYTISKLLKIVNQF